MPSPFAITTTANAVSLDAQRRSEVSFTVSNTSGSPIRGRAQLTPDSPASATWLTLTGEAEQDFPTGGTQQYTVKIAVPADTPAGTYSFRLNMVGVENPDELFTQGPTVTFQVPEPEPKKPFPWWIVIVAVGVLALCALGVGGILFFTNLLNLLDPTTTPSATPTRTPTPTNTPIPTDTSTLKPDLMTKLVHEHVSIPPGHIRSATVSCPGGSIVVSGGYAANSDVLVYTHLKEGNGWQVSAKNNAASDSRLDAYATCLHNAPGASTTQVHQQVTAYAGGIGHPVIACPAGSIVTGGGWVSDSTGSLWVYNSSKSDNSWQVYARNSSASDRSVNAYAICLSGISASTEQIAQSTSIAAGATGNATATCETGKLVTGGGFAASPALVMYNTSPSTTGTNQWHTYAKNLGSSRQTMYGYAICLLLR